MLGSASGCGNFCSLALPFVACGVGILQRWLSPRRAKAAVGFHYPPILHIAPSSVSSADSFPEGKPTCFCYVGVFDTVVFYNRPHRACQSPSPGGRWAGQRPGSDEGEPCRFHSVGNSPTGPRRLRGSSPPRSSTSPPHQSAPLTASPEGKPTCFATLGGW